MQNQIIYGTKLIANSEIKLSRKKYNHIIEHIAIQSINVIFYSGFKCYYF